MVVERDVIEGRLPSRQAVTGLPVTAKQPYRAYNSNRSVASPQSDASGAVRILRESPQSIVVPSGLLSRNDFIYNSRLNTARSYEDDKRIFINRSPSENQPAAADPRYMNDQHIPFQRSASLNQRQSIDDKLLREQILSAVREYDINEAMVHSDVPNNTRMSLKEDISTQIDTSPKISTEPIYENAIDLKNKNIENDSLKQHVQLTANVLTNMHLENLNSKNTQELSISPAASRPHSSKPETKQAEDTLPSVSRPHSSKQGDNQATEALQAVSRPQSHKLSETQELSSPGTPDSANGQMPPAYN